MMSEDGNVHIRDKKEQDATSPTVVTVNWNNTVDNANDTSQHYRPTLNDGITTPTTVCVNAEMAQIAAKVESLKNWTVNRFKTTKQSVFEQLGKVEKTVDTDMDSRIATLNDLHNRYREMYNAAKAFNAHFSALNKSQRLLAESFYQLSLRELDLRDSLSEHSETLRQFCTNGDCFSRNLGNFVSSLETLSMKTITDTLQTVQVYENARLEYDAHRHELALLQNNSDAPRKTVDDLQTKCDNLKLRYEQLKEDVRVKIALLEENRLKVMRAQLAQFEKSLNKNFAEGIKSLKQLSPTTDDNDTNFVRNVINPSRSSFLEH